MDRYDTDLVLGIIERLERIASALETLANATKNGIVQTEDVARAKVYSTHLGEKLRKGQKG